MKPSRDRQGAVNNRAVATFFEFSLLGLVTSGYLAVVGSGYLDLPTTILTAAGLLLRALLVAGVIRLQIRDRWIALAAATYVAFYPLDYFFLSREFLPATVHLVFFVGVVRILTARSSRDYLFVKVIAFLELLAASVLSSNLSFFLFLALFLLFGVATFASSEIRRSAGSGTAVGRGGMRRFGWRLATLTLFVAAGILAMTAGLFFVLPRTARAAFQHLAPERYHLPGFSNQVVLGQIGELKQRSTPVLRARIYGRDHPMPLKWRGAALAQFDGRRWYNPSETGELLKASQSVLRLADDRQRWRSGERINYEVQINEVGVDALFFAGVPEFVAIPAPAIVRTPTDSFRLQYGSTDGLRYGAYSFLEGAGAENGPPAPPLPDEIRTEYLLLPNIDPRIIRLARQVTANLKTDRQRAEAIEEYLRSNYTYSLELPVREPADPLADFLFERRKGHCEYFASAMAVMLRAVWVPSRVATGFQSGTFNPVTRWQVIRASDAHSWVEAFLPGVGWHTFDPTPPDPAPAPSGLFARVGMYLDAAETFWQEWVLNYNLERQVVLAYRMEQSGRNLSLPRLARLAAWARGAANAAVHWLATHGWRLAVAVFLALAGFLAGPPLARWLRVRARVERVRRGEATAGDATLLYQRMLGLLEARGLAKPGCLTPLEFLRKLPPSPVAALAGEFTTVYNDVRFGGRLDAASRLMQLLERLEGA